MTEGPYRIVRHLLYVCEGIAIVGVMLQAISPLAVLIACRGDASISTMTNEEAILFRLFPEYRAYAAQTAPVSPGGSPDYIGGQIRLIVRNFHASNMCSTCLNLWCLSASMRRNFGFQFQFVA